MVSRLDSGTEKNAKTFDESGIRTHAPEDQITERTVNGKQRMLGSLVWRLRPLGHLTHNIVMNLDNYQV